MYASFLFEVEGQQPVPLDFLPLRYPEVIHTIVPELDMTGVMKEVTLADDPSDPGVQFQLLYLDLNEAVQKRKMGRMVDLGDQCLDLARQQDWPHLQVAVYFSLGSSWMAKKEYPSVLESYDHAYLIAQNMTGDWQDTGIHLQIQALFARA
ncbi:MAG: hypothetical protein KDC57_16975 [Saprospiraceae bacterium]|nr:hypothetical protein [Saprospiraceae bacterium]